MAATRPAAARPRALIAFLAVAAAIVVGDQLLKAWVVGSFSFGARPTQIVGDWLEIDLIHNAGGLFGMLQGSAPLLGLISVAVLVVLVAIEWRMGWRSWLLTLTLALLLGGAIGNLVDRMRFGYVVDFVNIGIGSWRFYVFNLADSAVTVSICLVLGISLLGPWLEKRFGINLMGDPADKAGAAPRCVAAVGGPDGPESGER